MGFYKIDDGRLLVAERFVHGSDFELDVEHKDSYQYPVDGWYWFDSLQEAITQLSKQDDEITPLQAKVALYNMGLLDDVEVLVKEDRLVELYWNNAQVISRNNAILLQITNKLGLSASDVDNLFSLAKSAV